MRPRRHTHTHLVAKARGHASDQDREFNHYAFFLNGHKVVGEGANSNLRSQKCGCVVGDVHAEAAAILNSCYFRRVRLNYKLLMSTNQPRRLSNIRPKIGGGKLEILVVRANRSGDLMESKPCSFCHRLMSWVGIHKVHYSTAAGEMVSIKFRSLGNTYISRVVTQAARGFGDLSNVNPGSGRYGNFIGFTLYLVATAEKQA